MPVPVNVIQKLNPISELSDEFQQKIAESSQRLTFSKGKIIFKRGKDLSVIYYLLSGSVNLIDAQFETASLSAETHGADALNDINPSRVSAVAASEVTVIAVDRKQFDLVMAWSESEAHSETSEADGNASEPMMQTAEIDYLDAFAMPQPMLSDVVETSSDWMSSLLESPLFTSIPAGNIQKLFGRFEEVEFEASEMVIEAGQEGDFFYVIAKGEAVVLLPGSTDCVALAVGDYFGEEALVGDTTRNASIQMKTPGILMRLAKSDFIELLQEPLFRYIEMNDVDEMGPLVQLLDVRLPVEHRHFRVKGSRNIALSRLRNQIRDLDPGLTYIVTDDGGSRSKVAVQLLLQTGLSAAILSHSEQHYR
ncbi:cyclic nucleotide-binding domain-containing protein [Marinibactrum halimedae]|uniref:Cyclic nucleotide-binding domain-containing protein n=1 Tax=Marinibactrum halimedae TaxID=1444977 RepID=A0AA37T852_9GAMM|nr:cyclic nucleotide-binding domain-containing protein [Marinibactrum halimedae]MCD9458524.1 cyclic nucleotide-binding domain-containing protein [Marinibactrum halimedae]GLS26612.1 hypothetical protein GCM10007877_23280 [Marinibactrum halimedae]